MPLRVVSGHFNDGHRHAEESMKDRLADLLYIITGDLFVAATRRGDIEG